MLKSRRMVPAAALLLPILAMAGTGARAQDAPVTVGPPQLRDFQLPGTRTPPPAEAQPRPQDPEQRPAARQPAQPRPAEPRPTQTTPPAAQPQPAPVQTQPAPSTRTPPTNVPAAPTPAPVREPVAGAPRTGTPAPATGEAPAPEAPVAAPAGDPLATEPLAPIDAGPAPAPVPAAEPEAETGTRFYYYLVPLVLAGLAGLWFLRRRRKPVAAAPVEEEAPIVAAPPPAPRPEPIPRPWLELEFKAERAASSTTEASVEFEIVFHNAGKSPARNIRVNARMFAAGQEQDKEIGLFFRTKGEGRKTHVIPELPPGERALIQGNVTMAAEDMRALKVKEQLLFIPVVAINLVYEWGTGRTGQTSKSYVVGRELGEDNPKMGAFRLDLGPRVYRTVGQRPHSLARRV